MLFLGVPPWEARVLQRPAQGGTEGRRNDGIGHARASGDDRGGAIAGNHIDLFFSGHRSAMRWGKRWKHVKIWLPPGCAPPSDLGDVPDVPELIPQPAECGGLAQDLEGEDGALEIAPSSEVK